MLLGISDRNKMVLWPGCGGRAEFSRHTKNVRSVRFVVKRRGCCYNLSCVIVLIVWFTTNGMCAKNKNVCMWCEQAIIEWSLLLLAATVRSLVHMPLGISDRNTWNSCRSKRMTKSISLPLSSFVCWQSSDKDKLKIFWSYQNRPKNISSFMVCTVHPRFSAPD